jgi:hypothetical protein
LEVHVKATAVALNPSLAVAREAKLWVGKSPVSFAGQRTGTISNHPTGLLAPFKQPVISSYAVPNHEAAVITQQLGASDAPEGYSTLVEAIDVAQNKRGPGLRAVVLKVGGDRFVPYELRPPYAHAVVLGYTPAGEVPVQTVIDPAGVAMVPVR